MYICIYIYKYIYICIYIYIYIYSIKPISLNGGETKKDNKQRKNHLKAT